MLVGITYDLRMEYLAAGYGEEETAEFDSPETVEAIEQALESLGHRSDRIGNARQLVGRLAQGDRWDLVFNFAEGLRGVARESQVPCLLDVYEIPYTFSDPLVLALSLDKGMTKRVLRDAGISTPDFVVVNELADLDQVRLPLPVFAKPVAEGTGKGIGPTSKITSYDALRRVSEDLLRRYRQAVLVETFLPGREFTVGIWGTGGQSAVIGTMEVILKTKAEPDAYSYVNKELWEDRVEYRTSFDASDAEARRAEEIALAAWRVLGCRDAGRIDLRSDACGQPQFIEVNPLAGLHPTHSDLPMICAARGIPYAKLIERIVASASQRVRRSGY